MEPICFLMFPRPGQRSGVIVASIGALLAFVLAGTSDVLSPLVLAVLLGAVAANLGLIDNRFDAGLEYAAKRLLRVGVVLLGFRLSLGDVAEIGLPGLAVVTVTLIATFFGVQWLGARMGLSKDLSLLIGTGFAICGASAVAAMDGVIEAEDEETAYALSLVAVFGSLSILTLPVVAALLGLSDQSFGSWAGAAVHDVAQTVATAATRSEGAEAASIVVKLTRVLFLAPVVAFVALRRRDGAESASNRPPVLPLFVLLFLLAVAFRSLGWVPSAWLDPIKLLEKAMLTAALFGLGAGVRVAALRHLGGRPLLVGLVSWLLVAGIALGGVLAVG